MFFKKLNKQKNSLKKHSYIIIRYSLLEQSQSSWKIARDVDYEEYKNKLFDSSRLSQHERLFRNITIPSLVSMNPSAENFTLLVLTSELLPSPYLDNLKKILRPFDWANVLKVPDNIKVSKFIAKYLKKELSKYKEPICYSTTRLDDDDALSSDFLLELDRYVSPEFNGFCVSFGSGITGIYNGNGFEAFHRQMLPKIALGLSYINTFNPSTQKFFTDTPSIYNLGNHAKIDSSVPTILDSRKPIFFRTMHFESDSTTKHGINKVKSGIEIPINEVTEIFKINI